MPASASKGTVDRRRQKLGVKGSKVVAPAKQGKGRGSVVKKTAVQKSNVCGQCMLKMDQLEKCHSGWIEVLLQQILELQSAMEKWGKVEEHLVTAAINHKLKIDQNEIFVKGLEQGLKNLQERMDERISLLPRFEAQQHAARTRVPPPPRFPSPVSLNQPTPVPQKCESAATATHIGPTTHMPVTPPVDPHSAQTSKAPLRTTKGGAGPVRFGPGGGGPLRGPLSTDAELTRGSEDKDRIQQSTDEGAGDNGVHVGCAELAEEDEVDEVVLVERLIRQRRSGLRANNSAAGQADGGGMLPAKDSPPSSPTIETTHAVPDDAEMEVSESDAAALAMVALQSSPIMRPLWGPQDDSEVATRKTGEPTIGRAAGKPPRHPASALHAASMDATRHERTSPYQEIVPPEQAGNYSPARWGPTQATKIPTGTPTIRTRGPMSCSMSGERGDKASKDNNTTTHESGPGNPLQVPKWPAKKRSTIIGPAPCAKQYKRTHSGVEKSSSLRTTSDSGATHHHHAIVKPIAVHHTAQRRPVSFGGDAALQILFCSREVPDERGAGCPMDE